MANWTENLRPASFRGVSFFIESADQTGGRHTVVHEYPQLDKPYAEDIGARPHEFQLTGFVIGDDYMQQRDDLITALDTEGPGVLIHPYRGSLNVNTNGPYTIHEEKARGRMATITMSFVLAADDIQPFAQPDTLSGSVSAAQAALNAVKNAFAEVFSVIGDASYEIAGALSIVCSAANAIDSVKQSAKSLAAYKQMYGNLVDNVETIINTPSDLADGLAGLLGFNYLDGGDAPTKDDLDAAQTLYGNPGVGATADAPVWLQTNNAALLAFIQQTAVVCSVRASAEVLYASADDALAIQEAISGQIDDLRAGMTEDEPLCGLPGPESSPGAGYREPIG